MKLKDILKEICFSENPKEVYAKYSKIDLEKINWVTWNFNNKNRLKTCRGCNLIIDDVKDFEIVNGYWFPYSLFPVHSTCRNTCITTEAYDCQCIDKDCNDCKFFDRNKQDDNFIMLERALFPRMNGIKGFCTKRNCTVLACPNHCSGFDCFVHRKD